MARKQPQEEYDLMNSNYQLTGCLINGIPQYAEPTENKNIKRCRLNDECIFKVNGLCLIDRTALNQKNNYNRFWINIE